MTSKPLSFVFGRDPEAGSWETKLHSGLMGGSDMPCLGVLRKQEVGFLKVEHPVWLVKEAYLAFSDLS